MLYLVLIFLFCETELSVFSGQRPTLRASRFDHPVTVPELAVAETCRGKKGAAVEISSWCHSGMYQAGLLWHLWPKKYPVP